MKRAMLTSVVVLAWFSGEAMAACGTPYLSLTDLKAKLPGNTVCSPASCAGAACTWQEQHRGAPGSVTGQLWDYKKGNDPVDPTEQVGTWTIQPGSPSVGTLPKVVHSYGNTTYVYDVKDNGGGNYSFCGSNGEFPFSIHAGIGGCP